MQPVPLEVRANFERRLDAMRVPPPQRPDYRKWVRFYFDFCHKYGHSTGAPASRGPFLAKLASKNQSVAQRSQASAAVELLVQSAPEPGATRPSLTTAPTGNPRPPLNSRPPVLSGCGERGLRAGGQVPPVPPQTPRAAAPGTERIAPTRMHPAPEQACGHAPRYGPAWRPGHHTIGARTRRFLGAGIPRPRGGDPPPQLLPQNPGGLPLLDCQVSELRPQPPYSRPWSPGGARLPLRPGGARACGGFHPEPGV